MLHDDVIKWKRFPRYWPFVWGIHRSPVNSSHKGQWRGALIFSLICVWINGWVNNREAGDLRRYRAHYDVTVMKSHSTLSSILQSHSNRHGCWCSGAYLAPGHLQQLYWMANTSLQWRHNERHGVSNHHHFDCMFSGFVQVQIKENIKASCQWPSQRASNSENVSIWWRHHGSPNLHSMYDNISSFLPFLWDPGPVSI